nr:hypothetical protein [Amylibacter sp.]
MSEILTNAEEWIGGHIQLVTLVLVPSLTILLTTLFNRSAEKRSSAERLTERELASQLKLVEFRQSWIQELRAAIVDFGTLSARMGVQVRKTESISEELWEDLSRSFSKIQLLMNPLDQDYKELMKTCEDLIDEITAAQNGNRSANSHTKLDSVSQRILKREWDRLKSDLSKVIGQAA